ncbi:MAG TPA: hypothetical protein VMR75_01795 [Candidatus Saccharimonadales bacterium]|nr:hypothetical protein [Candidatus Saccharimonadales bacterium]
MNEQQLRQIIVPSFGQVITCIAIAALILVVAFGNLPYQGLLQVAHIHRDQAQTAYESYLNYLDKLTALRVVGIGIFWLGVALIAYVCGLALVKALVAARNDVVTQTEFVGHPSWAWRAKLLAAQVALAIGFLIMLVLSVTLLLSLWLGWFQGFITSPSSAAGIIALVGSFGGLTLNIYLIWTLGQIVFLVD